MTQPAPGDLYGGHLLVLPLGPRPSKERRAGTFLAVEPERLREVALTMPDISLDQAAREVLEDELSAAASLNTPELPLALVGDILDDGCPVVASEWISGISLRALAGKRGLPPDLALPILGRVTGALAALHEVGLIHGDVHAGNVLLAPDGTVRLVGWAPSPLGGPSRRFQPEDRVPRYAPPEWFAEGQLTAAGDCYGLGLMIYELFTGHSPLPPASFSETHLNQVRLDAALDSGKALNKSIPAEFLAVIRNLLQVEMRARWQTGGAVLEAMAAIVPDESPLVEQAPIPERELLPTLRRRARSLVKRVTNYLKEGQVLPAAGSLRRLSSLLPRTEHELRGRASELLEESLWYTFRIAAKRDRRSAERERQEALSLLLLRAARELKAAELAELATRRLAAYARPNGPLAGKLPSLPGEAARNARIAEIKTVLAATPAREIQTLELGCLTPGFHGTDASELRELKVSLLERHGLYPAALFHRAQALGERGDDPAVMDSLLPLLERCILAAGEGQVAPEASSAPPPVHTPPPAPSTQIPPAPPRSAPSSPRAPAPSARRPKKPARKPVQIVLIPGEQVSAEDRFMMLNEARLLIQEGHADRGIETYHQLLEAEALYPDNPDPMIAADLRSLVWMAVVPEEEHRPSVSAQAKLYALVHAVNPPGLLDAYERFFLGRLPTGSRERWVEEVMARNPWSLAANMTALEEAEHREDTLAQARYRVTIGQELLQLGAVKNAIQILEGALALAPDLSAANNALEHARLAAEKQGRAASDFPRVKGEVESASPPSAGVASIDQFLSWHPNYLPALALRAELAERCEDGEKAAVIHRRLASVAMLIDKGDLAQEHLRKAIRNAPTDEESILLLAYLTDAVRAQTCGVLDLQCTLLVREGLADVAQTIAESKLARARPDPEVLHVLSELARARGEDPTPYRVQVGTQALGTGDAAAAREIYEACIKEATNPLSVIELLEQVEGIEAVFSRQNLTELRELFSEGV